MKILVYSFLALIFALGIIFGADYFYEEKIVRSGSDSENKLAGLENQLAKVSQLSNPVNTSKALENSTPPTFSPGFDWSLPVYADEEKNSGFIAERNDNPKMVKNSFLIVRWDESNPAQGKYDFSRFERHLDRAAPQKVLVRLEVNSACEAPQWALKKLRQSSEKSLIFWDKEYLEVTKPFIQKFAFLYASNPRIIGVQLGLADGEFIGPCDDYDNKQGWGEFWMSPQAIAEAQDQFGFNPEVFAASSKANIDVYADAFDMYKSKLVFTNLGPLFTYGKGAEPYNQKLKEIADYVLAKGIGSRDGEIEHWMSYADKIYGNIFTSMADGTCRMDFNESYAKNIEGRYWGTENEFYGDKNYVLDKHGPYENQPYRFLISSLRALQMRRNYMSISNSLKTIDHPDYKTQHFMRYLTKVMGKQIGNTPDAFVLLGERYIAPYRLPDQKDADCVNNSGGKVAIRSFGRWLTETSDSTPAIKISMPKEEKFWDQNYYLPDGIDYEYFARASKQFNFDINDQLTLMRCENGCEVEVKATIKDTLKTSLNVLVEEGGSLGFETNADGQIKTVTFKVKSKFLNKPESPDIILKSEQGAIPLILMRVNFL